MMTRPARWFVPMILWTWGGIFVYFYVSGRLQSFLHPHFRPLVLGTGMSLLIAGWLLARYDQSPLADECLDGCGQPHATLTASGWLKGIVMLLPLLGAVAISPDGFGSAFVLNRYVSSAPGIAAAQPVSTTHDRKSQYLQTDAAGCVETELIDFRYAAQSPDLRKDMEHKNLEVIGQYVPTPGADRRSFTLTRLFVICCAADAQPINVSVKTATSPPNLSEMTWIKVTGAVRFENTDRIVATPIITATEIQPIPAPKEKYLY